MLRKSLAFLAAASMSASPVLAQQSAAPLSVARTGAATEDGSDLGRGGWLPPALFALIVLGGILMATGVLFDDDDDDDLPDSP